jgi:hypothetical protein
MIKLLKELVTELKRSNDLKEKDIKNKEMNGWYMRANTTTVTYSDPIYSQSASSGMISAQSWTGGRCG